MVLSTKLTPRILADRLDEVIKVFPHGIDPASEDNTRIISLIIETCESIIRLKNQTYKGAWLKRPAIDGGRRPPSVAGRVLFTFLAGLAEECPPAYPLFVIPAFAKLHSPMGGQ